MKYNPISAVVFATLTLFSTLGLAQGDELPTPDSLARDRSVVTPENARAGALGRNPFGRDCTDGSSACCSPGAPCPVTPCDQIDDPSCGNPGSGWR